MDELYSYISQFSFRNELWILFIPLILMAIDIITGVVKAWVHKNFRSDIMRAGLGKKTGEIVILVSGEVISYGLGLPEAIMNGISFYIIFMEGVSILENADQLGVPIPKFVKDVINNVGDTLSGNDKKD